MPDNRIRRRSTRRSTTKQSSPEAPEGQSPMRPRTERSPSSGNPHPNQRRPARRQPDQARQPHGSQADVTPQRLHKILAASGVGSLRAMEELIVAGRISVNGKPAHVGQPVSPADIV